MVPIKDPSSHKPLLGEVKDFGRFEGGSHHIYPTIYADARIRRKMESESAPAFLQTHFLYITGKILQLGIHYLGECKVRKGVGKPSIRE